MGVNEFFFRQEAVCIAVNSLKQGTNTTDFEYRSGQEHECSLQPGDPLIAKKMGMGLHRDAPALRRFGGTGEVGFPQHPTTATGNTGFAHYAIPTPPICITASLSLSL
jgi:hypothetical protein